MSVQQVNERLAALTSAGTSVWLDQIRRSMIDSGELARMVEEDSLRGVTSNPGDLREGDPRLARLRRRARGARARGPRARARSTAGWRSRTSSSPATCCAPSTTRRGGPDGYVSLEVAPRLAHDTEGTLEQARQYWGLVDRPNVMIKIPATDAGIPAIEEALYEGLNVNVTLLFAVSAYERVMEAFVRAMERRHEDGRPLDRHSVASFFVSRVDSEVDKRLEAAGRTDLAGRAGLANARAAYRAFQRRLRGRALRRSCARRAAPSSARCGRATGVKNPQYPETLYVYGLVAPHTVNTMPLPTLMAARQEGEVTGATAAEDPTADLDALREAGIDLDDVTDKLLRDGIDAFMVPMAKLLDGIERKREAIVTHRPAAIEADLPAELEPPLAARVKRAARRGRRAPHLAARRHAVGARGHAGARRPPRLADDRRQAARGGRRARRVRRRVQGRRADRRRAARAWAARASRPRSSASPTGRRTAGCACTCSTPPTRCRSRPSSASSTSAPRSSSSPRSRAGRSRRSRCSSTSTASSPTARTSCSSPTPARRCSTWPRRTASAARSRTTPRSAAATRRCPTSGSCPPRWPASTCGRCSRAPRSPSRRARTSRAPRTTRACGSASRSASSHAPAATS